MFCTAIFPGRQRTARSDPDFRRREKACIGPCQYQMNSLDQSKFGSNAGSQLQYRSCQLQRSAACHSEWVSELTELLMLEISQRATAMKIQPKKTMDETTAEFPIEVYWALYLNSNSGSLVIEKETKAASIASAAIPDGTFFYSL